MNIKIDLESCFIGFLIGVAVYLLLKDFFGAEGWKGSSRIHGNGVHGGGGQGNDVVPTQAPTQAPTPRVTQAPTPRVTHAPTHDELELKNIITGAITDSDQDSTMLSFQFQDPVSFDHFKLLLKNNVQIDSKNPLVSLGDHPKILRFGFFIKLKDFLPAYQIDTYEIVKIVNCFQDNIKGIRILESPRYVDESSEWFAAEVLGDIKYFNYLKDLEELDLTAVTDPEGNIENLRDLINLKKIKINPAGRFSGNVKGDIEILSKLTKLESIDLPDTGVHGDIGTLSSLNNLSLLNLCPNKSIRGKLSVSNLTFNNTTQKCYQCSFTNESGVDIVDCGEPSPSPTSSPFPTYSPFPTSGQSSL